MNTNIANVRDQLPVEAKELKDWIVISNAKLGAMQSARAAATRVGVAKEICDALLEDTQVLAAEVLYAEARLGELYEAMPKNRGAAEPKRSATGGTASPDKMDQKERHESSRYQRLAHHPEIIEAVCAEAKEVGKVPTREAVLSEITARKRSEAEEKRKAALQGLADTGLPEGIFLGDFKDLSEQIEDESVELIFTDPPYDRDSIPMYEDAARIASRILKPGGSFIAYCGTRHLPEVLTSCSKHLTYWWTCACIHDGGNQILNKLGVRSGWKPLVWFVKGTRGDVQNVIVDTVSGGKEKDLHDWQQAEAEAAYFIGKLTSDNGVVVDFFLGSGTTSKAAERLNRKFIGFEKDEKAIASIISR